MLRRCCRRRLLRHPPPRCPASASFTPSLLARAVTAALAFETSLTAMAKEKAVLKGKIFQSLLEDLRAGEESHAQVDLSARGESGGAEALGISRTEWVAMQAQADMLRKLVRIKIAGAPGRVERHGSDDHLACPGPPRPALPALPQMTTTSRRRAARSRPARTSSTTSRSSHY